MEKKGISTRMRNIMNGYVGKIYSYYYHGRFMWTVKIVAVQDCGYFITELREWDNVWQSNASYGEVITNIKKGRFVEI